MTTVHSLFSRDRLIWWLLAVAGALRIAALTFSMPHCAGQLAMA